MTLQADQLSLQDPTEPTGLVVLFTGLSGAGKTTLASALQQALQLRSIEVELLDGDEVRRHDPRPLGFTREAREENIRRLGLMAQQRATVGKVVIIAAIAPFQTSRQALRQQFPNFIEVFVDAPLTVCEARDPKGLYRKARAGQITSFTGIDSPYEQPLEPEVRCCTGHDSLEASVDQVFAAVLNRIEKLS